LPAHAVRRLAVARRGSGAPAAGRPVRASCGRPHRARGLTAPDQRQPDTACVAWKACDWLWAPAWAVCHHLANTLPPVGQPSISCTSSSLVMLPWVAVNDWPWTVPLPLAVPPAEPATLVAVTVRSPRQ